MINRFFKLHFSLVSVWTLALCQTAPHDGRERPIMAITGRILDANSGKPIEYANVVLFRTLDSVLVTGMVSREDGVFRFEELPHGSYYIRVSFMGFEPRSVDGLQLNESTREIRVNDILLAPLPIAMQEVVVQGQGSPLSYRIDKKVIDVGQLNTSMAGTAADVLENVPSVSVDIEGNVSLRGKTNFTVLIDGRQTIIDPQDLLQQIPASAVARIEIITNPSAKYDPEGTAGIINLITNKNLQKGLSGVVNATGGLRDKYGGDFTVQYKNPSYRGILGVDYNNRFFPGTERSENTFFYQDTTAHVVSAGGTSRGREFFGLRGGLEFNLGESDFVEIQTRYRERDARNSSQLQHEQWYNPGTQVLSSTNRTSRNRGGESYSVSIGYLRKFAADGHELSGNIQFESQRADEETLSELVRQQLVESGKITTERGPSKEINSRF